MEDDYAEQLRKVRQAAVAEQERQAQEVRMKAEKASQDRREAEALRRQKEQKVRKRIRRERLLACIVPVAIIIFTIVLLRDPAAKGAGFLGFVIIVACLYAIFRRERNKRKDAKYGKITMQCVRRRSGDERRRRKGGLRKLRHEL